MATVKCALGKRGRPSHEWNDGEKDRIYCLGWVDPMTDAPLPECLACPDFVNKAQDDLEAEYIKREALLLRIDCHGTNKFGMLDEDIRAFVKAQPAVDAAPVVHGLWMPVYESEMTGWDPAVAGRDPIGGYICSACKEEAVYDCNDKFVLSNYCPHCGARMEGSNEHETD